MKLLLDVNIRAALAAELKDLGVESKSWLEVGDGKASDPTILSFAATNDWTVVTKDLHFCEILASSGEAWPSVILVRVRDTLLNDLAQRLAELCKAEADALDQGAFITLEESTARIRILPFR